MSPDPALVGNIDGVYAGLWLGDELVVIGSGSFEPGAGAGSPTKLSAAYNPATSSWRLDRCLGVHRLQVPDARLRGPVVCSAHAAPQPNSPPGSSTWAEFDEAANDVPGQPSPEPHWTGSEYLVFVADGDPLRGGGNWLFAYGDPSR